MGTFRHILNGTLPAGDIFSFGFSTQGGGDLGAAHAATSSFVELMWGTSTYQSLVAEGCVLTGYKTILYTSTTPLKTAGVLETEVDLAGINTHNSLPQDMCVVLSLRTAVPGPKGRGRMYLPAPCVDSSSAIGELTTAAQDNISAWAGAALGDVSGAGFTPVVVSRTTGVASNIVNGSVGTVFDAQRRRVNKVNTVRQPFAL